MPGRAHDAEPFVNVPAGSGLVDRRGVAAAMAGTCGSSWLIVEFDHVDGVRRSTRPALVRLPVAPASPAAEVA